MSWTQWNLITRLKHEQKNTKRDRAVGARKNLPTLILQTTKNEKMTCKLQDVFCLFVGCKMSYDKFILVVSIVFILLKHLIPHNQIMHCQQMKHSPCHLCFCLTWFFFRSVVMWDIWLFSSRVAQSEVHFKLPEVTQCFFFSAYHDDSWCPVLLCHILHSLKYKNIWSD